MAGPVAQVLFSTNDTPSWRAILEETLGRLGPRREADSIQVMTTRLIGGLYEGDGLGRPFLIGIGDEQPWSEMGPLAEAGETRMFYERTFGVYPDSTICLSAMSNQRVDHRILGEIALALAQRLGGVIDLCGLIVPRQVSLSIPDFWNAPWSAVQSGARAFTEAMPGIAVARTYRPMPEREWASHTVDAAFLQAWLSHPEFHMIK
ncbi:DUF6368 family protein [Lichenicoccus sp.]|uniref:DUF6368 family protein n=1 Tax=Lichenicoccus sp. TaxID=2781899 RepID=UPI003D116755